jgi:B-box zinc finger protein
VSTASIATCENHPQREAIGVCVQCRTRVCSECSTKVEGINYCVRCLAGLAREGGRSAERSRARPAGGLAYVAAAGYLALLSGAMWILLNVLLPGS